MTDKQLTALYNEANGITGKRLPITTARIFAAMRAAIAGEREACAKVCDEMVDWSLEQHPAATITDSPQYLIGIQRGLVNATNAIRARSNAPHEGPGGSSPGPLDAVVGPRRTL